MENPDWNSGNPILDMVCRGMRALPFSVHKAQKELFFDTDRLLAVNGESVVVANGADKVDKFMFRYPGRMACETFKDHVSHEVGAVTTCLAGVALDTEVSIKPASVFRNPKTSVLAVVQTQPRLDLATHRPIDLAAVAGEAKSPRSDRTARDLETMLKGTRILAERHGYHPDVAHSSGNLRCSIRDGSVTLLDVMPIHEDGSRLIGDRPPGLLGNTLDNLEAYQAFVGQYGA